MEVEGVAGEPAVEVETLVGALEAEEAAAADSQSGDRLGDVRVSVTASVDGANVAGVCHHFDAYEHQDCEQHGAEVVEEVVPEDDIGEVPEEDPEE